MLDFFIFGLSPLGILLGATFFLFWIWMVLDAFNRGQMIWALILLFFGLIPGYVPWLSCLLYFFLIYLPAGGGWPSLPSLSFVRNRNNQGERIQELKSEIYHLDKPHSYHELGKIYLDQEKYTLAEENLRAAFTRDKSDLDIQAHLGACLSLLNQPQEALPFLQKVIQKDPQHDYGQTLMIYAETLQQLSHYQEALEAWQRLLQSHTYSRARVQYAQLLFQQGAHEKAQEQVTEVINDEPYMPAFQRQKEKKWIKQAKALQRKLKT